jgi:transcriptional regulator with XRE-family HTH domain
MSRGLRQHQLAAVLDVPRPFISQFENGVRNPTPQQLNALGQILGCAPERLMEAVSEVEVRA